MALSSDEIIKREVIDEVGFKFKNIELRIFPESSNDDQKPFTDGGLTFGYDNIQYGSCDAVWYIPNKSFKDNLTKLEYNNLPVIALEGTDALRRGSNGNAQYQRFHHALGAVKNGLIGIYYLKKGKSSLLPDLYGMAYNASKIEKGTYIITQDLSEVKTLLEIIDHHGLESAELKDYLEELLINMKNLYDESFKKRYKNDWNIFAKSRSTIFIEDDIVVKYAGRNVRNFTESSQRAGHIAVGEMFLTKYFFPDKKIYYFFPRMTKEDIKYLNNSKKTDKEWSIIKNEKNVILKTLDDLIDVPINLKDDFESVRLKPLKGENMKTYNTALKELVTLINENKVKFI
ncbi:hypothetical protein [Mammaliicoccus sciuri]|uniref:hypothetical protein n=1 Tax=Mammaliicoccus sciuri TaxID=1296 RepID=UPI002B260AC9|nr:hypothetical protein [Mammaliicoccus sciuri]WQK42516.1 hypothetical protein P3T89_00480 [Mammaliicoccus sciuri]